jgi:hypothetical protein
MGIAPAVEFALPGLTSLSFGETLSAQVKIKKIAKR